MKNLADLLNSLATTAGIAQDNEEFKTLVQVKELATTNIPDELGKLFTASLDGGLLSLDAAKNNKEIKDHFTALALNGVDTEFDKLELDPEIKTSIAGADSTYKKVGLIHTLLKSKYEKLIEEAGKGDGKEDPEKMKVLTEQITALNGELGTLKESTISKEVYDTAVTNHATQLKEMGVKTLMSGRKLISSLPREVVISAGMDLFNKSLAEKGITLDSEMNFKTADGSMDYFDKNNQKVKISDFIDTVLTENKLLDVSPPGGGEKQTPPGTEVPTPPPAGPDYFDNLAQEAVESHAQRII